MRHTQRTLAAIASLLIIVIIIGRRNTTNGERSAENHKERDSD